MKVILIPMCTVLGLACINVSQNPLTPTEERCVQEYLSELKHYILYLILMTMICPICWSMHQPRRQIHTGMLKNEYHYFICRKSIKAAMPAGMYDCRRAHSFAATPALCTKKPIHRKLKKVDVMKLFITLSLSICLSLYVVQTARGGEQLPTQASFEKSLLGKNPTEVMVIMGGPPTRRIEQRKVSGNGMQLVTIGDTFSRGGDGNYGWPTGKGTRHRPSEVLEILLPDL